MKIRIILALLLSVIMIAPPLWANNSTPNSDNIWQCTVNDSEDKEWVAKSAYERVAISKAFEACKKESRVPTSCKPAKESCDDSMNNENESKGWQCSALDQKAKSWFSKIHGSKENAALDAKANCEEHSSAPDSCYINLFTCKNLNTSHRL
jgi:hypothetical protein